MKGALFTGDRGAVVKDFPDPVPKPGQVVVKMKAAAICGSDMHVYRLSKEALGERAKIIPGHEPSGVVVGLGGETHRVRLGDRVSVYHYLGCGSCKHCLAGNMMWCNDRKGYGWHVHGSDADYLITDERNCLLLPDDLTFIDGAFIACIAGTAYSSMRKLKISGEDTLAVFGLGPVGLCGVMVAKAMGGRVIGIDVMQERLRLAQEVGADAVIDAASQDPVKAIDTLTRGEGADAAFETSGKPKAQAEVISALGYGGRGVFVGIGSQEKSVNPSDMVGKQLTLIGSFVSPISYYWDLVDFIRGHKLNFGRVVTHRFPITEAQEAFRTFDGGKTGKVVFEWD